jgi:hypothetical protein
MPAVIQLRCKRCDYEVSGIKSITIAIKSDGSEAVCPHPLERREAEAATGESWKQLARRGRIRYRYAMACLGCGELDYYGRDQLGEPQRHWTHIGNIISSVTTREARRYSCEHCGRNQLYPLARDETEGEILREFFNWLRGVPNGPVCPACHTGRLHAAMVAIS